MRSIRFTLPALFLAFFTAFGAAAQNFTVQFFGNTTINCVTSCVTLNPETVPSTPDCVWIWSNGQTNQALYTCQPGAYTVTVTQYTTGATATATAYVTGDFSVPFVNIVSSNPAYCSSQNACERVCPGATVTYEMDGSVGSNVFPIWQVSGAAAFEVSNNQQSVTVTWGEQGVGNVGVVVTNTANGCTASAMHCVLVVPEPKAVIAAQPAPAAGSDTLQACTGQAAWFSASASLDADTYDWFFADDQSESNSPELEHYFYTPGLHEVRLIARSACLCADTTRLWVNVRQAAAPQLECFGTVCSGATVTYRVNPSCPDLNWSVQNGLVLGDSGDSLTVQWQNGPAGIISLSGLDCDGSTCPGPVEYRIPVLDNQAEIEGPNRVCISSLSAYHIETFGGTGYSWTLSGGGTIASGQGTSKVEIEWGSSTGINPYYLVVTYDNCYLGCQGRDTLIINLLSPFIINGPAEVCPGATGNFTARRVSNNQTIACFWTLYDPNDAVVWTSASAIPNPAITLGTAPGWYRIRAVPANPALTCDDEAFWRVRVAPMPSPATGITGDQTVCPGVPLTYEAQGFPPNVPVRWYVNNGPGAQIILTGNPVNVSWGAPAPHTLSVVQVSTDGLNCLSPAFAMPVNLLAPLPVQGPTPVCEGEVATYTTTQIGSLDYQWSIQPPDAGAIKSGQGKNTVEIFWQKPGNHQLALDVCGQITNLPVNILGNPQPAVTHPDGLCPGTTGLAQTTTPFTAYEWQSAVGAPFGQNATADLPPGNYVLTVTDANGCRGNVSFTILEYPKPNLTITTTDPTGFCNNSRYVNMEALTTADGDYVYDWFQDGVDLNYHASTLSTNQYGNFSAQVSNQFGCTASDGPIWVFEYCGGVCHNPNHPPVCPQGSVDMAITPAAVCDSFHFQLLAGPNYDPGTAFWRFGESGATYLGQVNGDQAGFHFPNAGQYLVVLYAYLQNGAQCIVVDSVEVEAAAQFKSELACAGSLSLFEDVSTFLPSSGITNWQWNFGDPASGAANNTALRNPDHGFSAGGNYPISLTVTANSGCTSTVSVPTGIPTGTPAGPQALTPGCVDNAVELNAANLPELTKFTWDFGDPGSGAANQTEGRPVYHEFATAGNYTVTLTTTNAFGCTNTETTSLSLSPNSLSGAIAPPNPAPICEGKTLTLQAPPGATNYLWSDGVTTAPSLTVGATGVYDVTLIDAAGCTYAPAPVSLQVRPAPNGVINAQLFNEYGQLIGTASPSLTTCYGEDVLLQAQGIGLATYLYHWSVNENVSTLAFTEGHNNLLSAGTHIYTVTVTEQGTGCTAVLAPFQVLVNPSPGNIVVTANTTCTSNPVTLSMTNATLPDWEYLWNTGETSPSMVAEHPGRYKLKVTNQYDCVSRSNEVLLLPGPNVDAIPSGCHTRCRPDSLCLPALPNITAWQWYHDGAPVPGATTNSFVAQQSGTYWAELTDNLGCTAQSDPLTLNLYDGFGNVLGQVWYDVNANGAIDPADTLMPGVAVQLLENGVPAGLAQTNTDGNIAFANIPAGDYALQLDLSGWPAGWSAVIGQQAVSLAGCGDQAQTALLVAFSCPPLASTIQLDACAGGSALYNGAALAAGSSEVFSFTTSGGCDSTVTVTVTALPASSGVLDVTACAGGSFDYNGTLIAAGASQNFTLQNAAGCDSILTVNVTALPASSGVLNATACAGGSFDYNGTLVAAGSSQNFTLQNAAGCDSILTVNVSVLPASAGVLNAAACAGESFDYNGTLIAAGASQNFTLQNAAGCDSILTVNVSVLPASAGALNVSACAGDAYDYNGTLIAAGSSQNFTLQNAAGCDSILTVTVSVLPASSSVLNASVCAGESFDYNGTLIAAGASQNFTLQNAVGCDSILTVNVSVLPASAGVLNVSACAGDAYNYNGTLIAAGASQNFTLQNAVGCDSILTVNVSVLPASSSVLNASVCAGESFDYNGTLIAAGASQNFTLQNAAGCDSILTVTVTALPPLASTMQVKLCPGEGFLFQGVTLQAGDNQTFNLTSTMGCDSAVTVAVTALNSSFETLDLFVCPGETYTFDGVVLQAGEVRTFTYANSEGCDSVIVVSVTAFPAAQFDLAVSPSCPGAPTGSIAVSNASGGATPYLFAIDGTNFQPSPAFGALAAGTYSVWLEDANGCRFQEDAELTERAPLEVVLPPALLPCDSSGVVLAPAVSGDLTGLQFRWSDGSALPVARFVQPGPVWVEVENICETRRVETTVEWATPEGADFVYLPNVFAPEAENPQNAEFRPVLAAGLTVLYYRFEVYDRWGNRVFGADNPEEAWPGPFRQRDMQPGVYVWTLDAHIAFCGGVFELIKKGDVMLMR